MKARILFAGIAAVVFAGVMITCSRSKTAVWGDPETGFILRYRQNEVTVNRYKFTSDANSETDVMGQTMKSSYSVTGEIEHRINDVEADNIRHQLSFTDLSMSISGMAGNVTPNVQKAVGAPLYVTTHLTGARLKLENVAKFPVLSEESEPIEYYLLGVLLEFPEIPVKYNDSWTATRNLNFNKDGRNMEIDVNYEYTLIGMEKRSGIECLRINSKSNIAVSGKGIIQGMPADYRGSGDSEGTCYFAYQEGKLVHAEIQGTVDLSITMGNLNMIVPVFTKEISIISLIQ